MTIERSFHSGVWKFAILLVVSLSVGAGCARTPQFGDDGLKAADALWTAVTARRPDLVEQTAAEVESLHAHQKLSDEASASLSRVISSARARQWAEARAELKSLIRAQRPRG